MTRVGLVGCGTVGRALSARLLARGYPLFVHDHARENAAPLLDRGAEWAATPEALGEASDVIVSCLPRPADVEAAIAGSQGAWSSAAPRTLHIETSTVGVACMRRLRDAAGRRKIRLLDAPLSRGGIVEDRVGITLWVGGNVDHFDLARPVLDAMADRVLYCGAVGHGQVTKLVNNLISHALVVHLGDALALGVRGGVPLDLLHAALHEGTAQNRDLDELLPASVFRGDWRPGLRLDLAIKDLRLAEELAAELGMDLTAFEPVLRAYERARERGFGELSSHAVVRLVEEATGIELRSPIFERAGGPGPEPPSDQG